MNATAHISMLLLVLFKGNYIQKEQEINEPDDFKSTLLNEIFM